MMPKDGLSMSNTELKNQYTRNVAFRLGYYGPPDGGLILKL